MEAIAPLLLVLALAHTLLGGCGRTSMDDLDCIEGDERSCAVGGRAGKTGGTGAGGQTSSDPVEPPGGSSSMWSGGRSARAGTSSQPPMMGAGGSPAGGAAGAGGAFDCAELPEACTTSIEYGHTFGQNIELDDLALDPAGNYAIAATGYDASVDFGPPTSPLEPAGANDGYLAAFVSSGAPTWATVLGGPYEDRMPGIAFDSDGNLVATGFQTSLGAVLTKLDQTGTATWSKAFASASGVDVAVSKADGVIAATGQFWQLPVDFGAHQVEVDSSGPNTYVAAFDAGGNCTWAQPISSWGTYPTGVAIDSAGNVIVVGTFSAWISFGLGEIDVIGTSEFFIAKYDPSGNLIFAKTSNDGNYKILQAVAVDHDDNILVAGSFDAAIDLGTGEISGSSPIVVAKFDNSGFPLWTKAIESTGQAMAFDVAVDASNNVLVGGSFEGTLQTPLEIESNGIDGLVLKLDPDGAFTWIRAITGSNEQTVLAIGTDDAGNVFAGGRFFETIDFGQGEQSVEGTLPSIFIAKLAP